MKKLVLAFLFVVPLCVLGQSDIEQEPGIFQKLYDTNFIKTSNSYSSEPWYSKIKINGYLQFRLNTNSNPKMNCDQCDATYGGEKRFVIRRMRLKVSGFIHPKVYFYFQGDFASDGVNLGQLRDAYGDIFMNKNNTIWMRFGQSKVLYGFDNMQSSQNRIPLDRSDAINSAIKNERDLMISFYYTPQKRKQYFTELIQKGLKGSGNYGMISAGVYNGQTANASYADNDNGSMHGVLHFSVPFKTNSGQYIETSLHGYYGEYQTLSTSTGTVVKDKYDEQGNPVLANGQFFKDTRVAASFMYYPQPFGFQMEYNVGIGPEYEMETSSIRSNFLHGGYITLIGNLKVGAQKLYPFIRAQYYKGGKKFELDARKYDMYELEFGTEWSPYYPFEIQLTYSYAQRNYSDGSLPINDQNGHLLRVQFQVNY